MTGLYHRDEAARLINAGKNLLVAGDVKLMASLPKGNWIGGSIPYFMTDSGATQTAEQVFLTELPAGARIRTENFSAGTLPELAANYPKNGFAVLLIPAFSPAHVEFAKSVASYPGIFDRPLVGWIAGCALDDIGKVTPCVIDGATGETTTQGAVAMFVELPADDLVHVEIINLFRPGTGPTITFSDTAFEIREAKVDGQTVNFAEYLEVSGADTKLPLVANYNGAYINVSIQAVSRDQGKVALYAPVFPGIDYKLASPIGDYVAEFKSHLPAKAEGLAFGCNCILNYVYAGLEGRSTAPLTGPITFGEIAYMLHNQTAVYLTVERAG